MGLTTASSGQGPLTEFHKLSDAISLYRHSSQHRTDNGNPSLIVLCTWMAANPRHIAKYTNSYKRLYPNASILVVQSMLNDMTYRSSRTQQKRIEIARDIILNTSSEGKVLLHIFSNGGANTACQIATSLPSSQRASIFSGMILDSCPGRNDFKRANKAILAALPKNPMTRFLGSIMVYLVLTVIFIIDAHGGQNAVTCARNGLNDDALFGINVPRLYIFSKEDEMVGWSDVQDHAKEAKRKGFKNVQALVFEGSGHCAHAMQDSDRYWNAVKQIGNGGVDVN